MMDAIATLPAIVRHAAATIAKRPVFLGFFFEIVSAVIFLDILFLSLATSSSDTSTLSYLL